MEKKKLFVQDEKNHLNQKVSILPRKTATTTNPINTYTIFEFEFERELKKK